MRTEDFQQLLPVIPRLPGVYRFIDERGGILYVGKAKNLRNRLSSYFGERKDRLYRTRIMVSHACRIEFTVVETETDALLLENALIKEHQPRYNIMLKDDKTYAYICIKQERFPRVFLTRRLIKDGSHYFGPYTSKQRATHILELIKHLFPLRSCSFALTEDNIRAGKFKLCLEYHIKNCNGPCEAMESHEVYMARIEQIRNILRGHYSAVVQHFKAEMHRLAEALKFEEAQQLKDKLRAFEDYQSKSTIVSVSIRDVDVFSIINEEKEAYVNYIKVVDGAIINTHTQWIVKNIDEETEEDILAYVIPVLRDRFNSQAPEILTSIPLALPLSDAKVVVPKIGDKKKLLELSEKNVRYYQLQRKKSEAERTPRQKPAERILQQLQQDLGMSVLPVHLECFDNSNIQGSHPVSSCVVFKDGKPSKKDYRHYNVKTVEGPNDFASMQEVVYRRYRRLLDEGQPLPQLVIIDGGKGQLGAAMESLRSLGIADQLTVIGIAKRLEEIYFPGDSLPLHINKKSESLKLIQQARNEAHRFAITFHRQKRSQNFTATELTDITGIGQKTAEKLLQHFGSVKNIREATVTALRGVAGLAAAQKIRAYFDQEQATGAADSPPQ